jgi:hypothetical protein
MARSFALLGLIPLVGLAELGFHGFFAARAPDAADYAALGAELSKLKRPGEPVVVAPAWAEPWVRQAAPGAFPLNELARAEDRSFSAFWEVSLLGQSAPDLASFAVREQHTFGAFQLRRRQNPSPDPIRFDFVAAVDEGRAEVITQQAGQESACAFTEQAKSETGGLHGHAACPRRRYVCGGGRLVGVSVIEDRDYRPRRCVLAQPPDEGDVVVRFTAPPSSARLVGFVGAAYFLERDDARPRIELEVRAGERDELRRQFAGAQGWTRFELGRPAEPQVEVRLRRLTRKNADFCFSLEAR